MLREKRQICLSHFEKFKSSLAWFKILACSSLKYTVVCIKMLKRKRAALISIYIWHFDAGFAFLVFLSFPQNRDSIINCPFIVRKYSLAVLNNIYIISSSFIIIIYCWNEYMVYCTKFVELNFVFCPFF